MIDELEVLLKSAVIDVLKTMLSLEGRAVPLGKNALSQAPHIAGCVGFIGQMTGVVHLYAAASFARRMTARMLGIAEAEIEGDEMVDDAIGELAGMVADHFNAALVDRGHSCVPTVPSIARGNNFSIEPASSATQRVMCFRCGESENLVVEMLVQPSEA